MTFWRASGGDTGSHGYGSASYGFEPSCVPAISFNPILNPNRRRWICRRRPPPYRPFATTPLAGDPNDAFDPIAFLETQMDMKKNPRDVRATVRLPTPAPVRAHLLLARGRPCVAAGLAMRPSVSPLATVHRRIGRSPTPPPTPTPTPTPLPPVARKLTHTTAHSDRMKWATSHDVPRPWIDSHDVGMVGRRLGRRRRSSP